ncbi:MAG: tRNA pseudouridine(38-40) synthase TruA [Alphaproteobacteria bacterium]|nr:tRNA pseudouridine(38-40) synthase TruA [Alphaproteobacteria bacterium]
MTRYKLTIEYQGTDYYGWQRQPDLPTIQGEIEKAIHAFCGQEVEVTSAGRTDAGVHARGQIAHVDLDAFTKPMDPFAISKAINAHLRPQPITIISTEIVDDDFHARFAAKNKLYAYRIINRQAFLTFDKGRAWHVKRPLDTGAMHEAAQLLLGQHDFSTFRDAQCQANNPIRTLDRLDVQSFQTAPDKDGQGAQEIFIEVEAMSFLHHMVRNLVGTLTLVGEGKWKPEDILTALNAKDRTKGGPTAPSDGLYLVRIDYT